MKLPVLIEPLKSTLYNIQLKIDAAAGAMIALELRLRIIAELEPKVQDELKQLTSDPFYAANLVHLIDSVLKIFNNNLKHEDHAAIKRCRKPRNKLAHASLVEFMLELNDEALGREIDRGTGKGKPLQKHEIVEGAKCIERSRGLDDFACNAREAVLILEREIFPLLQS